jgi:hypothetical protein
MKYENLKFRIKDEAHSKEVQELLFKLGYEWNHLRGTDKHFANLNISYLRTSVQGHLACTQERDMFLGNGIYKNSKEVNIQYLKMKLGLGAIELDYPIY